MNIRKTLTLNYLLIAILLSVFATAQLKFEKGYYINNNNEKIAAQIYNEDWLMNPNKITIKNTNGSTTTISTNDILGFGIDDVSTYENHEVQYDKSSSEIEKLSLQYNPEYVTKKVMLKKIVNGKFPLYENNDTSDGFRFFYMNTENQIIPLVYKKYYPQDPTKSYLNSHEIAYNDTYKEQIENLSGEKLDTRRISYTTNDMIKAFNKINGNSIDKNRKVGKMKFYAKAGISYNTAKMETYGITNYEYFDLKNSISPVIGVGVEYILPFAKNKFSVLAESNYYLKTKLSETYVTPDIVTPTSTTRNPSIEYSSWNIGIGAKYRFFLTNDLNVFIKPLLFYEKTLNPTVINQNNTSEKTAYPSYISVTGSLGFEYKKIFIEFPAYRSPAFSGSNVNSYSIFLGYTF